MPASYPKVVKAFTNKFDFIDDVNAVDINDLQDEVAAIEGLIGVDPLTLVNTDPSRLTPWASIAELLAALEGGKTKPVFSSWDNNSLTNLAASAAIGSITNIPLPTPSTDNDPFGYYNGFSGFTVSRAGWYYLNASVMWRANASSGIRRLVLQWGATSAAIDDSVGSAPTDLYENASLLTKVPAGTLLRVGAAHTCDSVQTLQYPRLSGIFLRDV